MTNLKELQAKFKELDAENERIEKLRAESNKITDEINKLNEKMKVSPSFDLTQKLGGLTSGKQSFDESFKQHEAAFKTMIRKQYPLLKEYGDKHIIESIENVKEIEAAKTRVREVLKELLEENNKLDKLLNERWDKATEEVCSTKIEHYADLIDSYYIAPSITRFPNGLSNPFISELEEEIKHQEE